MYTSIRRYKGSTGLADQLSARKSEIETVIKGTPGFIAYYLVKANDGAVSITVCESKSGADTSNQLAADWLKKNMANAGIQPPEIYAGDVVISFIGAKSGMKA